MLAEYFRDRPVCAAVYERIKHQLIQGKNIKHMYLDPESYYEFLKEQPIQVRMCDFVMGVRVLLRPKRCPNCGESLEDCKYFQDESLY